MKSLHHSFYPFLAFCLFFTNSILSQDLSPIQTGPRLTLDAVFNSSDDLVVLNELGNDSLFVSSEKLNLKYGVGMFMQFNVREYLFLRPEIIVHISNRDLVFKNPSSLTEEILNHRIYTFSIPLQLGYRLDRFSLQTGIVFNNQLRSVLIEDDKENFKYDLGGSYTTFTVGLGFQSNWFLVDLYYETPFGKVDNLVAFGSNENREKIRHSHLSLKIGLILSGRD